MSRILGPACWTMAGVAATLLGAAGNVWIENLESDRKHRKQIERAQLDHIEFCKQHGLPLPPYENPWN
jgi:hypothetical protein